MRTTTSPPNHLAGYTIPTKTETDMVEFFRGLCQNPGRKAGCFAVVAAALTSVDAVAELTVSNVRSAQRVGTKLVDIHYDLTDNGIGTTQPATVALAISDDDGETFAVSATELSGAFGAGMVAGTDKVISWNAGVAWNNKVSANMRFEVTSVIPSDELVLIPAGSFQMGDQSNPLVGYSDELPVHSVQVSAFYMGKYEVTKELWDEVRAWGLNNGYTDLPTGGGKAATHPVHSIPWYAVVKWCNARSQKENLTPCYTVSASTYKTGSSAPDCNWNANGYRLPSEAEWEKAARGGLSGKNFPWGDTITHSQASYYSSSSYSYDTSPTRGYDPTYATGGTPYSSPVGSFVANGYGLYDMAGNMWEWCWDWYSISYYASSPGTDPRGAASGSYPVVRGGGWGDISFYSRAAVRTFNSPAGTIDGFGFRLARSSVP